ncbi:MAG: GRAM domain-containing protein, partial [archaeon]|nr:GRAM domain-containing protein [archaeon]
MSASDAVGAGSLGEKSPTLQRSRTNSMNEALRRQISLRGDSRSLERPVRGPTQEDRNALKVLKHFKDHLPNEEWVDKFACSLRRHHIYCQGFLFLTTRRLMFVSPLVPKDLLVPLSEIRGLKKAKSARVIPNAIEVSTKNGKAHVLSSFLSRDKAWRVIYTQWQREVNPSVTPSLDDAEVEVEQYAEGSDDTSSGLDDPLDECFDDDQGPVDPGEPIDPTILSIRPSSSASSTAGPQVKMMPSSASFGSSSPSSPLHPTNRSVPTSISSSSISSAHSSPPA